jgi:hypothetical protein
MEITVSDFVLTHRQLFPIKGSTHFLFVLAVVVHAVPSDVEEVGRAGENSGSVHLVGPPLCLVVINVEQRGNLDLLGYDRPLPSCRSWISCNAASTAPLPLSGEGQGGGLRATLGRRGSVGQ